MFKMNTKTPLGGSLGNCKWCGYKGNVSEKYEHIKIKHQNVIENKIVYGLRVKDFYGEEQAKCEHTFC